VEAAAEGMEVRAVGVTSLSPPIQAPAIARSIKLTMVNIDSLRAFMMKSSLIGGKGPML
jgi:hypothetical protein